MQELIANPLIGYCCHSAYIMHMRSLFITCQQSAQLLFAASAGLSSLQYHSAVSAEILTVTVMHGHLEGQSAVSITCCKCACRGCERCHADRLGHLVQLLLAGSHDLMPLQKGRHVDPRQLQHLPD